MTIEHYQKMYAILCGAASDAIDLTYTVIGGEIRLSSQRWISILDNAKIVEFE